MRVRYCPRNVEGEYSRNVYLDAGDRFREKIIGKNLRQGAESGKQYLEFGGQFIGTEQERDGRGFLQKPHRVFRWGFGGASVYRVAASIP